MNTILFDLDGTLLPMDQDNFIQLYFRHLVTHFVPFHISPDTMIKAVNEGTKAMVLNDGTMTNEERFWKVFSSQFEQDIRSLESEFYHFYETNFQKAQSSTTTNPLTAKIIQLLKQKGYTIVIATNPLFPKVATHSRIRWAGFEPDDVTYITTYETCSFCKPNLKYYEEILEKINKSPKDCIMVGNDVNEDMQVHNLGMERYLITDCLINQYQHDITDIPKGSMNDFYEFVQKLPNLQQDE